MKVVDISNPHRINRKPDKVIVLISDGNFSEHGFLIQRIELKLYTEKFDEKLGPYSLITANIETDKGKIETLYDEGFRGENALEQAAEFVTKNLGISALILRAIVSLKEELKKSSN
ncbi:MAG: hypothetical protein ACE5EJ_00335 [Nitrosopumilaceae archaeon]